MNGLKKVLAFVLVLSLALSLAVAAFAADSPGSGPEYDPTTDTVTEKIPGAVVKATVTEKKVTSLQASGEEDTTMIGKLLDQYSKEFAPIALTKAALDSVAGRSLLIVKTSSDLDTFTFEKQAFSNSKVRMLVVHGSKVSFLKDAFKGAKNKKMKIYLKGLKKASDLKVQKGSFKGLGNKAKIIVYKKNMSAKEYDKLVAKLVKAGFTGKIIRK